MHVFQKIPAMAWVLAAFVLMAVCCARGEEPAAAGAAAAAGAHGASGANWLVALFTGDSSAAAITVLALVAAAGIVLGSVQVFGISLGIAGVLFSGLVFGHFGLSINTHIMEFTREFGLILFVYSIGIQVGPGFIASLRREGLPLNLMAAGVVLLGAVITVLISRFAGVELPAAVGMFSGATTNTPSLAAAQSALSELPGYTEEMGKLPGLGYAVAYPFGVIGIIITMLFTRAVFRIDRRREAELHAQRQAAGASRLARMNIEITNTNLENMAVADLPLLEKADMVVSRVLHDGKTTVAAPDTRLHVGDVMLAVGTPDELEDLRVLAGRESSSDLTSIPGSITSRHFIVTNKKVLGKRVNELGLVEKAGVRITRVRRGDVELAAAGALRLQFGDSLLVVGTEESLAGAEKILGNSVKKLNHPEVIPLFIGIVLGVMLGSLPIHVPGMPAAVKLGLAGGPLVIAIVLSRIGRIGPLVWHMPVSANLMLRELGIVLFLACVGLKAGDRFVATLLEGDGFYWMALATLITLTPVMLAALIGRIFLKLNYMTLCGLLSGGMTDPPALAFACSMNESDAPMVSYATVYPLTMILRVLCAQAMVLLFM